VIACQTVEAYICHREVLTSVTLCINCDSDIDLLLL